MAKKIPKEDRSKSNLSFFLVMILISVAILTAIIIANSSITGKVIQSENTPYCRDVQVPQDYEEVYWEPTPYTAQECEDQYMIYDVGLENVREDCIQQECETYTTYCAEWKKDFWGREECARYEQKCSSYKCIKYTKYCNIKIENKERVGLSMNFDFYKWDFDKKSGTIIMPKEVWVPALSEKTFSWDFVYFPTESVGCWYQITKSPVMQDCRDVIKYQEIQKTRIVTRYRTETKCD